jgi:Tfp pilus assembly protein PilF
MVETRQEQFRKKYHEGLEFIAEGKDDIGMESMFEAAKIAPEGWLALSNELIKDGKYDIAEARCLEVLQLTKNATVKAAALNNLGMIYCQRGNTDAAREVFVEANKSLPSSPDPISNLALLAQWRGDFEEAVRMADRALLIDPWHEQGQFVRAMSLLLDMKYAEGFEAYECRWRSKSNGLSKLNTNSPEWNGSNGKRLLIYGEQGHGDSILMLRYAKMIKLLGVHQTWAVQKNMGELLKTMPEIDAVLEVGEPLPDFDCHIPAVSLPLIFKTTAETIPPSPYIFPKQVKDYGDGFHVGICWRGSVAQTNDRFRSTNLAEWFDVLSVPGVTFHSLQVDNAVESLVYPVIDNPQLPKDWSETASMIAGLDLVISVDTSIIHMTGALGVPCWCALHHRPYFVFPPKLQNSTPWYDSVRLFRANKADDWRQVFSKIATELRDINK